MAPIHELVVRAHPSGETLLWPTMKRTRSLAASLLLALVLPAAADAASLRFFGHGGRPGDDFVFPDRVKIPIEPPASANVGAGDFTIELLLRSPSGENTNPGLACGFGIDRVDGNILIDRDRYNQGRKFGIALLAGRLAFGASDAFVDYTLCESPFPPAIPGLAAQALVAVPAVFAVFGGWARRRAAAPRRIEPHA